MKKQLFRLSGTMMAALLVAGCASDPLDDQRNIVTSVSTSLSYAELLVGDSTEARAQSRDALGNALAALPDVSSANTAVVTITNNPRSGAPEPTRIFSIVATGFGITTVTASSGSSNADITVQTFPASVSVTGIAAGTQVSSGGTVQLTATPLGTDGTPVAGSPSITWATGDASIATVDATGLVSAFSPGLAAITATTDGGAEGLASFEVIPGVFDGGITAAVAYGGLVTITPGSVAWTGAETLGNVDNAAGQAVNFIESQDVNSITFLAEQWGIGTHTLVITNVGSNLLAFQGSFDVTSDAPPNNPDTAAPDITAGPFPMVFVNRPDPDDFYTVDPAAVLDLTVTYAWGTTDDLDILWVDCAFTAFLEPFSNGATSANPEVSIVSIPANECRLLWFNLYAGFPADGRVEITSP